MLYFSTRGRAPAASFDAVLLAGLAPDGGLYMPESWPSPIKGPITDLAGEPFAKVAARVLEPYVTPWLGADELAEMAARAFSSFGRADVAPLVELSDDGWLLELFHGPTLAFKDVAMQMLGVMFDRALAEKNRRATIIGATSGDTGGAAIEAFKGREQVDVFILHPKGKVSEVQRRMMTSTPDENVHNIAVEGTFDDCQRIVKSLFSDAPFAEKVSLSGVNSINWARLAVQTVYYFTALADLAGRTGAKEASFCVPTGNFGDAFAGYAALKMGAPIRRLAIAVNRNDILHRAIETGAYAPKAAAPTTSPSMDIQVASNFERILFEASGRNADAVSALMKELDEEGGYEIPPDWLAEIRKTFVSARVDEAEDRDTIARVWREHEMLIDPHTAVGVAAAAKLRAEGRLEGPVITLATAHPAKFPEAVKAASGQWPGLPAHLSDLYDLPERMIDAPAEVAAVREIIGQNARAGR